MGIAKPTFVAAGVCAGLLLAGAVLSAAGAGNAAKGKDIFSQNCSVCHNADSTDVLVGPGLKGLYKRSNFVSGSKKKVTDANVMEIINKGSPAGMPGFEDLLKPEERADLLAYLKTL